SPCSMRVPLSPRPTPFPYTTLFRSSKCSCGLLVNAARYRACASRTADSPATCDIDGGHRPPLQYPSIIFCAKPIVCLRLCRAVALALSQQPVQLPHFLGRLSSASHRGLGYETVAADEHDVLLYHLV